jgi:hypothetical protein
MSNTVVLNSCIQYTPPSAPINSGQSSISITTTYNEMNVGAVCVQTNTTIGTVIPIPFGTVTSAKFLILKNTSPDDIDVAINGSTTVNFTLPAISALQYVCTTNPTIGTHPITSISLTTLATPTTIDRIEFWVFGD